MSGDRTKSDQQPKAADDRAKAADAAQQRLMEDAGVTPTSPEKRAQLSPDEVQPDRNRKKDYEAASERFSLSDFDEEQITQLFSSLSADALQPLPSIESTRASKEKAILDLLLDAESKSKNGLPNDLDKYLAQMEELRRARSAESSLPSPARSEHWHPLAHWKSTIAITLSVSIIATIANAVSPFVKTELPSPSSCDGPIIVGYHLIELDKNDAKIGFSIEKGLVWELSSRNGNAVTPASGVVLPGEQVATVMLNGASDTLRLKVTGTTASCSVARDLDLGAGGTGNVAPAPKVEIQGDLKLNADMEATPTDRASITVHCEVKESCIF